MYITLKPDYPHFDMDCRNPEYRDFVIGTDTLNPLLDADVLLVSDGNPTDAAVCQSENISHEIVNLSKGQRVKGAYHRQNVNAYYSRFKQWLERFHGVATNYLANYLGWRHVLDKQPQLAAESLLKAALGNFQYLTIT